MTGDNEFGKYNAFDVTLGQDRVLNQTSNWSAYSHQQLYTAVHDNTDPSQAYQAGTTWMNLGDTMGSDSTTLQNSVAASADGWQGQAADAARNALTQLSSWGQLAGVTSNVIGQTAHNQADIVATAQRNMPEPVNVDANQIMQQAFASQGVAGLVTGLNDVKQQTDAANSAHQQAVDVMNTMESSSKNVDNGLAVFEAPPKVTAARTATTAALPRVAASPRMRTGQTAPNSTAPNGGTTTSSAAPNGTTQAPDQSTAPVGTSPEGTTTTGGSTTTSGYNPATVGVTSPAGTSPGSVTSPYTVGGNIPGSPGASPAYSVPLPTGSQPGDNGNSTTGQSYTPTPTLPTGLTDGGPGPGLSSPAGTGPSFTEPNYTPPNIGTTGFPTGLTGPGPAISEPNGTNPNYKLPKGITGLPTGEDPYNPKVTSPGGYDPLTGKPTIIDPVTGKPVTIDPVTGKPVTIDPVTGKPITTGGGNDPFSTKSGSLLDEEKELGALKGGGGGGAGGLGGISEEGVGGWKGNVGQALSGGSGTSGAGGVAAEEPGATGGAAAAEEGVPGAPGAGGTSGTSGAGGARGGKGDPDKERKSASYVRGDDEIFETRDADRLPPSVIGQLADKKKPATPQP